MLKVNLQPHIMCGKGEIHKYVLLPGDLGRVRRIGKHLKNVREIAQNRGYLTWNGEYQGVPVTVTSSGIGGPSMAIVLHELRNLDATTFIRVGSCGGLGEHVKTGDVVIPIGSVRDEGTSRAYVDLSYPAIPDLELTCVLVEAAKRVGHTFHTGINRSHDSFYIPNILEVESVWRKKNVISEDLETAALFTISGIIGVKAGCVLNTVVAYGQKAEGGISNFVMGDPVCEKGERASIEIALLAIEMMASGKI